MNTKRYLFKQLQTKQVHNHQENKETTISKNSKYSTLKEDAREEFSQKFKAVKPEKKSMLKMFCTSLDANIVMKILLILNVKDDLLAAKFSKTEWKAWISCNSPKLPKDKR
ncbi:hypothetical protein A0J61_06732 [Choanephora cucurbitarum]|uniref:Uncharacterized protein n=1 Tax=Choanephora cucurbitarum TaxID=101091 RepID=A0A1C7NCX4_9FUNG|nr:hypothetical protein A0J61_06732 [Choanephora cucurbitarum]